MRKIDYAEERYATMDSGKTREPLLLSEMVGTIRLEGVVARHKGVTAMIKYTMATGRLDPDEQQRRLDHSQ